RAEMAVMEPMPAANARPMTDCRSAWPYNASLRRGRSAAGTCRTRAMMPSREAVIAGTGARNARATLDSNSASDMGHLRQQCAEARERALDAHLERGFTRTGDSGHFFVGQVVGV